MRQIARWWYRLTFLCAVTTGSVYRTGCVNVSGTHIDRARKQTSGLQPNTGKLPQRRYGISPHTKGPGPARTKQPLWVELITELICLLVIGMVAHRFA